MFSFKASFFAALLSGAAASNPKLNNYEPQTNVADHTAGISQDQKAIEDFVGFDSEESFQTAENVYLNGGNSKSYAELTLSSGLPSLVKKGTAITGKNALGETISGKALKDYAETSLTLGFQYITGDQYENHVSCRVGGLPSELQDTSGCLGEVNADNDNTVTIEGVPSAQEYTAIMHKNGRTIAGFSTGANLKFKPGDDANADYFAFFDNYISYYGTYDFADKIATAAFNKQDTSLDHGNVKLSNYGFRARAEVAKKTTAYINTGLYVLREVYDAIYDCTEECAVDQCNDDAVHALDEAVGFYVGSEYVTDPDGEGNLFYALAEKRGKNFATAADKTSGQSEVNRKLMVQFNEMKGRLNGGQCTLAEDNAAEIVRLMQIPLIQGTLRYAYLLETTSQPTEKAMAEGAVFAAGILPNVFKCNEDTAQDIYESMRLTDGGSTKADFSAVKKAFESVYSCLDVTCEEVGGLVDTATGNSYFTGASPCGGVNAFSAAGTFTLSMGVGAVAVIAALLM